MRSTAALLAVAALSVQGCASEGCSDVGGFDGISLEVPRALFVPTGSVTVEVCDADACASATEPLGAVPEGAVGRGVNVTFEDFVRRFEPGWVVVTVELLNPLGKVVALAERDVELTRSYPNGRSCDGDGYLVGVVALSPSDGV